MEQLLDVNGLTVEILTRGKYYKALDQVSFQLRKGEIVGLVGESGCGKSMTALAVMGLLPEAARVSTGEIQYGGLPLLPLSEAEKCRVRGRDISMVFQEPATALNPLLPVGVQIAEALLTHKDIERNEAKQQAIEMMRQVGLSRAESLYWEYPHQLSGGMKQRIVIAMALMNHPGLLIADEPTTALDVTIQYQILALIAELNSSLSTTVLFVSHDFGVVHELCDRVIVMYAGYVVEEGVTADVLAHPGHPYTRQLLASIPTPEKRGLDLYSIPGIVAPLHKRQSGVCPFANRCAQATDACLTQVPPLRKYRGGKVRCLLAGEEECE